MSGPRTKYYLDKFHAKWAGVCAGLADYTGIDVLWVRVAAVVLTLMAGGWPIIIYIAVALLADKKPVALYQQSPEQQKFWQEVRKNPHRTTREVRAQFRDLDRRLADMERHYVSSNKRLADEIDSLR